MGIFDFIKGNKKTHKISNSDNKTSDEIMHEITSGLTKVPEKDRAYLVERMEVYKKHKYSTEILRACGRLLADTVNVGIAYSKLAIEHKMLKLQNIC